jgi:hypothetical protein
MDASAGSSDSSTGRQRADALCGLTFELSGPTPAGRLGREVQDKPMYLAAQVPLPVEVRSSEGLGRTRLDDGQAKQPDAT